MMGLLVAKPILRKRILERSGLPLGMFPNWNEIKRKRLGELTNDNLRNSKKKHSSAYDPIGTKIFIKRGSTKDLKLEEKVSKFFSGIKSINTLYSDNKKLLSTLLNGTKYTCRVKHPLLGVQLNSLCNYELRLKKRYKDLERQTIFSLEKPFPETLNEYIKEYTLQIAKIHAYGPVHFLNAKNNLISKEDYSNRFSILIEKKHKAHKKRFDKILTCYDTLASILGNSKIETFVKDARLKNALGHIKRLISNEKYTDNKHIIQQYKVYLIDFDPEHLRLAPPQHDLSKILLFSVGDRKKFLDEYIKTYNSEVKVYNSQYSQYGIKQEIKDKEEFEFVFLNSVVDYALFCTVEKKYKPSSNFHKHQIRNAVYAIDELKHDWKCRYTKKDLEQLDYIKTFLSKGI